MNFDFSDEQYMLRESVRRYLSENWGPREAREAGERFNERLWTELCELGLTTLLVPEALGGSGLGPVDVSLVLEEFGRALVPAPMPDTLVASLVMDRHGTASQRQAFLPLIAEGQGRFAIAHAEPGAGFSLLDVRTTARRTDEGWVLDGCKMLVAGASAMTHLLVSAREEDGNIGLFICEAPTSGLETRAHHSIDPNALLGQVDLRSVPAQPLGLPGTDDALALLLDASAFSAAAQMTGVAAAALDLAVAYAKDRVQFGRPIGSFQAIKHKCADMLVALESARSAVYYAGWALAGAGGERAVAVSMAKSAAGDACRLACNDALQIHGGVGFTWEFDIHLYLKRGKLLEYTWGDAAFHRERIASLVIDTH